MLLFASLLACVDETACTAIAVASTTVTLLDADGAPVPDATLTYTVDGEGPLPCDALGDGKYVCGYEASGRFVIEAKKEGYDVARAELDVGADECHPIPEAVTITLAAADSDCTDIELPSVIVNLSAAGGETLGNPQVAYTFGDTAAPIACESADGATWTCDQEQWGDYLIRATADAHAPKEVRVTVEPDANGCHPLTETVAIALDWLPD
jgi:hypothetical protein